MRAAMKAKGPMTEEEKKERKDTFAKADVDGDGLLNCDEFFTFSTALSDQAKARYGPEAPTYSKEESATVYAAVNALNSEKDGVAMPDLMRFGMTMKAINGAQ